MNIHYEALLTCTYGQTLLSGKPDRLKSDLCGSPPPDDQQPDLKQL